MSKNMHVYYVFLKLCSIEAVAFLISFAEITFQKKCAKSFFVLLLIHTLMMCWSLFFVILSLQHRSRAAHGCSEVS